MIKDYLLKFAVKQTVENSSSESCHLEEIGQFDSKQEKNSKAPKAQFIQAKARSLA